MPDVTGRLNPRTEGDARTETHAWHCGSRHGGTKGECWMSCRCWCHGITKRPNGDRRPDAVPCPNGVPCGPPYYQCPHYRASAPYTESEEA